MKAATKISDAEWEVMEVLWPHQSRTAAEAVGDLAGHRDWSENTIKTMLTRLVKKGVLEAWREGRRFHYRPICSREQAVEAQAGRLLDRVAARDASPLLSFFVANSKLNPEELAALRRLLAEQEDQEEQP